MLVAIFLALQLINNTSAAPLLSSTLDSGISPISVASCAASCVQNSIQQSFSVCADQQDLSCLCTTRGLNGYTIGEEILECTISDCQDATSDQLSQAYSICNSIPNAARPTHATITANIPRETTIFAPPIPPASASITSQPTTSSFSTTTSFTSSSAAQTTTVSSTSSSAAPTSTPINPVLTNPQIIGITVGLGALALIAMALLAFVCCFRRPNRPDSEQSFSTTQPLIPQAETSGVIPTIDTSQAHPYVPSKAQSFLGQKYSGWSPATISNPIYASYQGLTATPRPDERSTTPGSAVTFQTTSNLLPEKPVYPGPSRPPRDGSEGELLTIPSTGRTRGSPSTFQASPDSGPIVNRKPSDPFLQAPEPFYSPTRGADHERTARPNLPKLNTKTVQFAPGNTAAELPQQPVAPYNPAGYAEIQTPDWRAVQSQNTNAAHRGLALTIGPTALAIPQESASSFRPVPPPKAETTFNKYKPIPRTKTPRATSTVTSFETDDHDVGGPPSQIPPLPIGRKPFPATAPQNDRRPYQNRFEYQQDPRNKSSSPGAPVSANTPLSQVQYPTIPTSTATPVSRVAKAQSISARKSLPAHPFIAKQRQEQQSRGSPYEVSPLTPQMQRKEPFVLPRWDQELLDQMVLPASNSNTTTPDLHNRRQYEQNTASSPWERVFRPYPHDQFPSSPSPVDVSQLLDQGLVELPERSSGQDWDSPKATASSSQRNISTIPHKTISAASRPTVPESTVVTPWKPQPAPMMLAELPSPDAERLVSPLSQSASSKSPKSETRGARLGAAVANKTYQARPRGASDGNVQSQQQPNQRPGHMRSQSHIPSMKPPPTYNPPRPLDEIGLESAARRFRESPPRDVNGNLRGTAKYAVLCAPGQT